MSVADDPASSPPLWAGSIEPHAPLLKQPPDDQVLYKVMSAENLLRSVSGRYLHFNRVDSYKDFPGADPHDGAPLPKDIPGNTGAKFVASPDFTVTDYYNQSRARTYACSFSLVENSKYIWEKYGGGGKKGKVCVVFSFGKLRSQLNTTFGNAGLLYKGLACHQIFAINYGLVEYVDRNTHQGNLERLPNPIQYTYWKDACFKDEKELRISLSALGMGHFGVDDGSIMEFDKSLQVEFDFRTAIAIGVIQQLMSSPDCDSDFVRSELRKFGINS